MPVADDYESLAGNLRPLSLNLGLAGCSTGRRPARPGAGRRCGGHWQAGVSCHSGWYCLSASFNGKHPEQPVPHHGYPQLRLIASATGPLPAAVQWVMVASAAGTVNPHT